MRIRLVAPLCALAVAVSACGVGGSPRTTLTVLAAASLTDVFTQLGERYERSHGNVRVRLSFAGSQQLAAQVRQGVPADVIATANRPTMRSIGSRVRHRRVFCHNKLTIVVPAGNPQNITDLRDLARDEPTVVLGAREVPVGGYARKALRKAGVKVQPDSLEPSVRAVLTRVRLGEADAGIVYVTDAVTAGDAVQRVPIPDEVNVPATYPAAVIGSSQHRSRARAFVDWLRSGTAGTVLARYGFTPVRQPESGPSPGTS